eukprot:7861272-Pyramimonas_sp.AAC.1
MPANAGSKAAPGAPKTAYDDQRHEAQKRPPRGPTRGLCLHPIEHPTGFFGPRSKEGGGMGRNPF